MRTYINKKVDIKAFTVTFGALEWNEATLFFRARYVATAEKARYNGQSSPSSIRSISADFLRLQRHGNSRKLQIDLFTFTSKDIPTNISLRLHCLYFLIVVFCVELNEIMFLKYNQCVNQFLKLTVNTLWE